ncbi:hypothetical protein [Nocardia sp. NPDC057030]|uniref:hypothetical protein n=1 Tax=unclassified Nocardia TaxID=2637762 RepID=UPI003631B3AC
MGIVHEDDQTEAYMAEDRKDMTESAGVFLDSWLASMGSALRQWRCSYLPANFSFDFTLDSLDALEPVVLARYPDQAAVGMADNVEFTTATLRYIGEVLLRVAPARWGYQDRAHDDRNPYRAPVIRPNTPADFENGVSPEFFLHQLVRERERGTLRKSAAQLLETLALFQEAACMDPPAPRDAVPGWSEYFTLEEYNRFVAAVDAALGAFGADGQTIDAGYVSLAAGDPNPEVHDFDISGLAEQCRASNIEDWPILCFSVIDGYAMDQPQRDWLTGVSFAQVEDRLQPWLSDEPKLSLCGLDYQEQPFSIRLEDGRYLHFLAAVPELGGVPEITTFVPNSAVRAWNIPVEKLAQWGHRHL